MNKLHTHRTQFLALIVALLTLTVSFAGWRAQAGRWSFGKNAAATAKASAAIPAMAGADVVSISPGTLTDVAGSATDSAVTNSTSPIMSVSVSSAANVLLVDMNNDGIWNGGDFLGGGGLTQYTFNVPAPGTYGVKEWLGFMDPPSGTSITIDDRVTITLDTAAPTVTINQASGQADPTSGSPINFTVTFSEPVFNFATGDVTLSGTGGATMAVVTGGPAIYNVAVSGMAAGTVIATILGNVANDAASNGNAASTSTDNTVTYQCTMNPMVTTNADSGAGSLRQAVIDACPNSTITFAGSVTSPILLSSGQITIDKNLTIQGPGANLLTISGNNAVRIFLIGNVTPSINVTLSGLTLANGRVATAMASGGAIYNNSTGTLAITDSKLTGNSVSHGFTYGGAIYNYNSGTLNISNSTLSGNLADGGAIADGSAIYNRAGGTVNLTGSTLSGNMANVGGVAGGGGGINNNGGGIVTITNSTLSGNFSGAGGAIYNNTGPLTLTNSTLTGNAGFGGGIYNNTGPVTLKNTIIAGNTGGARPDLSGGNYTSQGFNLIGDVSGSIVAGVASDQFGFGGSPINPLLGPLAFNGGFTKTHRPLTGSPAIDKGNSFTLTTDQRSFTRPVDSPAIAPATGGDNADIGAVELFVDAAMSMIQLTVDPATNAAGAAAELSNAILLANEDPAATTIKLLCGTYSYSTAHNWEYGPNALPPITSDITIEGNGAVLDSTATVRLRFLYVSGGLSHDAMTQEGLPAGKLTLRDLTLRNGKQQGGNGGGGGMGAGGAIFNQGDLTLERVTLNQNSATGGSGGSGFGGGGMGQDAQGNDGGGFGGAPLGKGGNGGGSASGGSGGGGFKPGDNGQGAPTGVFHVALRRPEIMKRSCAKVGADEGRREVVS